MTKARQDCSAATDSSQVPWSPTIPGSWRISPVKAVGSVQLGKMLQSDPRTSSDQTAPYLRAANVQPDGVLALDDMQAMWFSANELAMRDLRRGDVVVVEGGVGGYGRAAYLAEDLPGVGFQNSIIRVRPFSGNDGRFLAYGLIHARHSGFIAAYCDVVSMPHLTAEKLEALRLPMPPEVEQRQIADWLDRETGRIDVLIAKQEQLISALRERRYSSITLTIARGLDPAVPLKDTGHSTLGPAPSHWTVLPGGVPSPVENR